MTTSTERRRNAYNAMRVTTEQEGRGAKRPHAASGPNTARVKSLSPRSLERTMRDAYPRRDGKHGGENNETLSGSVCRNVLNVIQRATSTYIAITPPYVVGGLMAYVLPVARCGRRRRLVGGGLRGG